MPLQHKRLSSTVGQQNGILNKMITLELVQYVSMCTWVVHVVEIQFSWRFVSFSLSFNILFICSVSAELVSFLVMSRYHVTAAEIVT